MTTICGKIPYNGVSVDQQIPGVTSVVESGTGVYTINLSDRYYGLASFSAGIENSVDDAYGVILNSDSHFDGGESTNSGNSYGVFHVVNSSDSAADLPSTANIWIRLDLRGMSNG
jgi:hypothetical protein